MTSTSANNGYSTTANTTVTNSINWIDSMLEPEEQKAIEDISDKKPRTQQDISQVK
jgi:hypothetical protein